MSAKEKKESTKNNSISFCDILKNNSSSIVKKVESQIPTYAQIYSDIYSEYFHTIDDLFGTCYISEKEFFDKMNFNPMQLKYLDDYLKSLTQMYSSQIDLSTDFLRNYSQVRISMMKTFDNYMHALIEVYAMMLAQYNSFLEK